MRETEQDPFRDSEDDEPTPKPAPPPQAAPQSSSHSKTTSASGSSSFFGSSKDKKRKDKGKKRAPFNLEAEKATMKVVVAESSIAATNLNNVLQSINREQERISDNATAVERFESCKKLRRKVLRYVSVPA